MLGSVTLRHHCWNFLEPLLWGLQWPRVSASSSVTASCLWVPVAVCRANIAATHNIISPISHMLLDSIFRPRQWGNNGGRRNRLYGHLKSDDVPFSWFSRKQSNYSIRSSCTDSQGTEYIASFCALCNFPPFMLLN